jgi:hypothetical protein
VKIQIRSDHVRETVYTTNGLRSHGAHERGTRRRRSRHLGVKLRGQRTRPVLVVRHRRGLELDLRLLLLRQVLRR